MNTARKLVSMALVAGIVTAGGLSAPAQADDTEVFFYLPPTDANTRPNVLFILDTGQSMGVVETKSTAPAFDPNVDWESKDDVNAGCDPDYLYFGFNPTTDSPTPTSCAAMKSVLANQFKCNAAAAGLASDGKATTQQLVAYNAGTKIWAPLTGTTTNLIECGLDRGVHADGSGTYSCSGGANANACYAVDQGTKPWGVKGQANKYPREASALSTAPSQTFYTANRVAYEAYVASLPDEGPSTRMEQLKAAMADVLKTVSGVNVALMRFSAQGSEGKQTSGGMVLYHFAPVELAKDDLIDTLNGKLCADASCPGIMEPLGRRPLGETLYEAYRYYAGLAVDFGVGSNIGQDYPYPSVAPSWYDGDVPPANAKPSFSDIYNSPVKDQICGAKNYIILLTDGFTEQDRSSDGGKIGNKTDFPLWDELKRAQQPSIQNNGACETATYPFEEVDGHLVPIYEDPSDGDEVPDPTDPKGEDVTIANDDVIPGTPSGAASGSYCVDDIADYMFSQGVSTDTTMDASLRPKVRTYTIGFDLKRLGDYGVAAQAMLVETAQRGGGKYYDAKDKTDLAAKMTDIVREILVENSSFTSPSVAVNSFNRTQNLNDLYFSVFKPAWTYRWLGNVKKYKLVPTAGPDCTGNLVCDPNDVWDAVPQDAIEIVSDGKEKGLLRFKGTSRSYWSDVVDGFNAEKGGAAGELSNPAGRKIYSNLESETTLAALSVLKQTGKVELANELLFGVPGTPTLIPGKIAPEDLVNWAYGGTSTTDARLEMGDPLHSKPAAVVYGGTKDNPAVTIFVTTNDGFLHAIDASTGNERWAFIPRQLLIRLEKLYANEEVAEREYGLDSPIRTLRYDKNGDGKIVDTDGDRVILYFGMRRGGSHYFAVDVTNPALPDLLWRIGAEDSYLADTSPKYLPNIGQTWSVPAIARINVGGHTYSTDNTQKWVLVFGGGYNTNHDQIGYLVDGSGDRVFDTTGNGIYMVDALTGKLLWRAGSDGGADLSLPKMKNAIPSEVRVVDISGDGFADRMYASDLGGQLWRFDIYNGKNPELNEALVTGGRLAALGNGDLTKPSGTADSRRFFVAPDPALITYQNQTFVNVAIGSGHREKPVLDDETQNRAYGIRDFYPFTQLTQDQYDKLDQDKLIRDEPGDPTCDPAQPPTAVLTGLFDVSTCNRPLIPPGSPGWKFDLQASGKWSGEKVLSESVTFQNIVYMPSYEAGPSADVCAPAVGVNRLYEVSAATGATKLYWDNPVLADTGTREDPTELRQGGIAPPVVFIFPEGDAGSKNPNPECLAGLAECGEGLKSKPIRTYWRQRGGQ